jgi:glyoxylase-like metal-dependent hydrolase (beta-lactamase superfamily II)
MMEIRPFFDPETWTLTYVVHEDRDAIVIDPVLDYDPAASQTSTTSLEKLSAYVLAHDLRVRWVLETHAHADHLSGSQWLARRFDAKVAIGERIREVQQTFKGVFDLPALPTDGSQFDRLLRDGETIDAGALSVRVIATPGHTPACVTYEIGDALFTGDLIFIEDYGTGRCDFPMGSASDMYDSIQKLYAKSDATRVFPGHDYLPGGRELRFMTTIGVEKRENIMLRGDTKKDDFVRARTARDQTLKAPKLIFPSVQVNIAAGRLPSPRANGKRYLTIPINFTRETDDAGEPKISGR